ncbi:hypothetical protein D3C74_457120 [compost metagenome]
MLNLKSVGCIEHLLIHTNVGRDRVNGLIILAVLHPVHVVGHDLFNIRSVFINQPGQIYNRSGIDQFAQLALGVDDIRVFTAGRHQGDAVLTAAAAGS